MSYTAIIIGNVIQFIHCTHHTRALTAVATYVSSYCMSDY